MKKYLIIALAAIATLSSCESKRQKEEAANKEELLLAQLDSLRNANSETENEYNELMTTVEQIQDGFRSINEAEGIVQSQKGEGLDKEIVAENLALIQNKLKLNRELIANLQEQIKTSNTNNTKLKSSLEAMVKDFEQQLSEKSQQIEELKAQLAAKDLKIAEQDQQITSLNDNVNSLAQSNEQKSKTIEQKTKAIEQQDKQIHTAYYVFGTKKELKEQRILESGEVLKTNNFNKDYFTKIDYRVTKTIKLYSRSAKLLTNHPVNSYSLYKDSNGQYILNITNPDSFWSVSKYLVILVK